VAANKRVFYAITKVGFAPVGSNNFTTAHGVQSVSTTTTFNLEQVFELAQLAVYENIEGIPDVEMSAEKVLDGWPPLVTLATQGSAAATLVGRSAVACTVGIGIYDDSDAGNNQATGNAVTEVHLSGLYLSSFGYEVTVDGNATETCSLVGNNKLWVGTAGETSGTFDDGTHWDGTSSIASNTDRPYSIEGSGGVNRREDILFGAGQSKLPTEIPGISSSGYNEPDSNGDFPAHFQRVSANVDLGRTDMFELGRRGTYHKFVNFPIEVTTEIGIMSVSGDMVSALEDGLYSEGGSCGRYNLSDQEIVLRMCEGLIINCGTRNKLQSVGMSGGDTGGGNQEITYTYTNFNDCTVTHPRDPTVALRP
jgi:hypothetical protein